MNSNSPRGISVSPMPPAIVNPDDAVAGSTLPAIVPMQNNFSIETSKGMDNSNCKDFSKGGDYSTKGPDQVMNQNVYSPAGPATGMQTNAVQMSGNRQNQMLGPQPQHHGILRPSPPIAPNPYPVRAPMDVQRAVQGEKRWKGANCLDCITKLKGDEERQGFLRKVFGILTAQTLFTVGLCAIVLTHQEIEDWLQDNIWFYFVCLALTITLMIVLMCFRKPARKVPLNYILLFTFTFFESMMVATITTFYDSKSVIIMAGVALVMFATIATVSLFTSRRPHTLAMMIYCCFTISLTCLFLIIFINSRWVVTLVSGVMLVICCVYVMIDIDLITEKHGLDTDEYIIAALFLYMDLVMIFLYLLSLFGERN
ncbi:unnamed protein product [Moneuplotes crassus]|uniref:Uncharacterized protein n=1 Tax=Euplotes crassus TaxID=5936 RepID=A0AAD2CWG4_EUPCR|nr:unnamed protein product [Moneuplotes crassus]